MNDQESDLWDETHVGVYKMSGPPPTKSQRREPREPLGTQEAQIMQPGPSTPLDGLLTGRSFTPGGQGVTSMHDNPLNRKFYNECDDLCGIAMESD